VVGVEAAVRLGVDVLGANIAQLQSDRCDRPVMSKARLNALSPGWRGFAGEELGIDDEATYVGLRPQWWQLAGAKVSEMLPTCAGEIMVLDGGAADGGWPLEGETVGVGCDDRCDLVKSVASALLAAVAEQLMK